MTTKHIPYSDHPPRSFEWVDSGERLARKDGLLEVVYEAISPCCQEHGLMAQGFDYWYCEDCEAQKMTLDEIAQIVLCTLGSYVNVDQMIDNAPKNCRSFGKYYRRRVSHPMLENGILCQTGYYGDFMRMWTATLTERGKQLALTITPRQRVRAMYRLQRMGYHISAIELPSDVAGF